MYYSVENKKGERRSPYTCDRGLAEFWARTSDRYFKEETLEVVASEDADNWPQVGDDGLYVQTI